MSPHFWRANEKTAVTRMYESGYALRDIAAATGVSSDAIRRAVGRWGLHRPDGHIGVETRANLAWPRIKVLLNGGRALTVTQICDESGLCKQAVLTAIRSYRAEIHVASYERTARHPAALWRLGNARDAEKPAPKRRAGQRSQTSPNPFLVAAGCVVPIETVSGRVIKQDMTIHLDHLDEMEAA